MLRTVRSENGQSMVEAALVFTLLVVIVLGLIDFAYIFQAYIGVVNAAGVGATYAATSLAAATNPNAIAAAALAETDSWHCTNRWVTSTLTTDAYNYPMIRVTVSCQVADLITIPDALDHIVVSSTAIRRVKQ
jgi:Flp pilus assembly protein TadG